MTHRPVELSKQGDLRPTSDHQASLSKSGHHDDLDDRYGDGEDDYDDDSDHNDENYEAFVSQPCHHPLSIKDHGCLIMNPMKPIFDSDLENINEGNAIDKYDEKPSEDHPEDDDLNGDDDKYDDDEEPDEGHPEEEAEEEGVEVEADNCVSAKVKQLAPKKFPE